jgi:thioredoxin-like negative regulator of GroEL
MNKNKPENKTETKVDKLKSSSKPILLEVRTECSIHSDSVDKIIKKIEEEYSNKIHIARIDYKTHKKLFPDLKLDSFPTVLLMNGSKLIKSVNGTISRTNLKNLVNELSESQLTINEKS